jgi:broad specificity phosphatase PhoE
MMIKILFFVSAFSFASCARTTYYVVRHAEKEAAAPNMSSDVELSAAGKERALQLRQVLSDKGIKHIYSTQTKRTTGTAKPLSDGIGVPVQTYNPADTGLVTRVKALKGNVLIVGHSNTVDDLVNGLTGKPLLQELPDTQYGDLFIVNKRGKKYSFAQTRVGL